MAWRSAVGWQRLRLVAHLGVLGALVAAALVPSPAAAQVQPYGTSDFRGFRNVLPPGANGLVNLVDLGKWETLHVRPPHNDDQLSMYSNLTTAAPNITESQIGAFFKDATFGVPSGDVASSESPEPGVTILRDSQFGVPHIYGDTRASFGRLTAPETSAACGSSRLDLQVSILARPRLRAHF